MGDYFVKDAAPATKLLGNLLLAIREAAATDLSNGDGTFAPPQVDANGNLRVVAAAAATPAGTNTIGATTDAGPAQTTSVGIGGAVVASADMTTAANITDAPTSGQKLVVTDFIVSSDTAMRFDFQEETSGTVVLSVYLSASSPLQMTPRGKIKMATANKHLQGKASVAGNVRVCAVYYSEA